MIGGMIGGGAAGAGVAAALRRPPGARLLPWLLAALVYIAGLGGAGLAALDDALRAAAPGAARLTLLVPADTSAGRMETVLALLRQTAGIASVHEFAAAETAKLLEPWLGPGVALDELPVPRLIDVAIDPQGGTDVAALRQRLAAIAPGTQLEDGRESFGTMRNAARRIAGVLAAAAVAALLLTALAAATAVRGGVALRRFDIELLQLLGAADRDILRPLAMRWFVRGLAGGAIGAAAAAATLLALRGGGAVVPVPGNALADWRVWAAPAAGALAAAVIAMASAGLLVRRQLARMP